MLLALEKRFVMSWKGDNRGGERVLTIDCYDMWAVRSLTQPLWSG